MNDNDKVLFGVVNFRNREARFGIKQNDRRRHMYIIGKTGMGKSELQKNIAIQDIQAGRGIAMIDAHGEVTDALLDYIPKERINDVIYINPADVDFPIAFNVMEQAGDDKRHLIADGVMGVFKKVWEDTWSARMEYILHNTILALLETEDATLLGINRMYSDKDYRARVIEQVTDPVVKAFWTQEFAKYTERFAAEATPAIQNKVGQFISSLLIRNIIGQTKSTFDFRKAMDEEKIILVNLSKGKVGEEASRLIGSMIITKLQLAAMSRANIPEHERKDFTLMVDEFQNFATASFASILSEARKYHLSLVVAHQYITQMEEEVRDAVFGNIGTLITFRVGAEDAEFLEKEFAPDFAANDIVNLAFRQIYLKLTIDGVTSNAFSAMTMDTIAKPAISYREEVIAASRAQYAHPRAEVEKVIAEWTQAVAQPDNRPNPSPAGQLAPRPQASMPTRSTPLPPRPPITPLPVRRANTIEGSKPLPRPGAGNLPPSMALPSRSVARPVVAPAKPIPAPVSLSEALKTGPVDFHGKPINHPAAEIERAFGRQGQNPKEMRQKAKDVKDKGNFGTGKEDTGNKVINHNSEIANRSWPNQGSQITERLSAEREGRVSTKGNVGTGTAKIDELRQLLGEITGNKTEEKSE